MRVWGPNSRRPWRCLQARLLGGPIPLELPAEQQPWLAVPRSQNSALPVQKIRIGFMRTRKISKLTILDSNSSFLKMPYAGFVSGVS